MRVGFFTDGYFPQVNGVTTSVYESAKELELRGHEVYIIAPKYPGYVDSDPRVLRVTSLKVNKEPEIRLALNLPDRALRRVLAMDFDIIHGHSGGMVTLMGWEIARAKKIPFVVTYHTLWNRYTHYFLKGKVVTPKMIEQATKIFGNQIDFLIAPTNRVKEELRSYGVKKPIKVVPSGINIDRFKEHKGSFLRKKLKLQDEPILLFVGRLGREKSVDFLLKSFRVVLKRVSQAQLVIIGEGTDRKKLERQSKRLGISKKTHFLGEVDNSKMPFVYQEASVFVFASTTETQGLVVPEALASGTPVVAVDDPAFECIINGKNGFLVKKDPREFAEKVITILENSELKEKMSQNASESSMRFSVKSTAVQLESVYNELLEKHNKESILRVMKGNEIAEKFYLSQWVFWMTIVLIRLSTLFPQSIDYPKISIGSNFFYHPQIAVFLLLLSVAIFIKQRKLGLFSSLLIGTGLGLIVNELWALIGRHDSIYDYWSPINLLPIIAASIVTFLLVRAKKKEPDLHIGVMSQKHINPENPKISIVIPAYNEEEFIASTLRSLVNQTYKEFELIVVDNNSTDKTAGIAREYGAKVIFEKKKGVAAARNAGFKAARGEIIACTDSDAIVPENWVEKIVSEFEQNQIVAFGGLGLLYSGPVAARAAGRYTFSLFWAIDKILSGGWNLNGFNMAVKKEAFLKIGGFNTNLSMGEDIDLAERLRAQGKINVNTNFMVFVSGRRYKDGFLAGLLVYALAWTARVFLRRDKMPEFKPVRSEKTQTKTSLYLPIAFAVWIISFLFLFKNY